MDAQDAVAQNDKVLFCYQHQAAAAAARIFKG